MRVFGLPPRCSSGILRSVEGYFGTDVSEPPLGTILTRVDVTDMWSRNVGVELPLYAA